MKRGHNLPIKLKTDVKIIETKKTAMEVTND